MTDIVQYVTFWIRNKKKCVYTHTYVYMKKHKFVSSGKKYKKMIFCAGKGYRE